MSNMLNTLSNKRTITALLHNAAVKWGDQPYMYKKTDKGWVADSFKDVDEKSSLIAAFIIGKLKLQRESKIILIAEGRPEWVEAEDGIMKAGCISVPLSVKLTIPEIVFRIQHSDAEAVIFSSNTAVKTHEALKQLDVKPKLLFLDEQSAFKDAKIKELGYTNGENVFYFDDALSIGRSILEQNPNLVNDSIEQITENDICVISYTSGTSGNPKGVMLMHKNYTTNAQVAKNLFNFEERSLSTLVILPTDHAFAHSVLLYHSLLCGDSIYFTDARKGNASMLKNFPINLQEVNPKFLLLVPAILKSFQKKITSQIKQKPAIIQYMFEKGINAGIKLLGDGYHDVPLSTKIMNYIPYKIADALIFKKIRKILGNVDFIVVGGAALDKNMQLYFNALGITVLQGYGMTETGPVISACTHLIPKSNKFGTVGKVAPLVECKIIKEDGSEAQCGERGDICVLGDSVMKGYYKNEEATREALINGMMNTGDVGFMDEDGFITVVGRSKAILVSSEGEKHSPEEIETEIQNESNYINQIILSNNENPYTIALVTIDEEAVKQTIKKNKITQPEDLYSIVEKDFHSYTANTKTNVMWQPAHFIITGTEWTEKEGFINSTMKIVRNKIKEAFDERMQTAFTDKNKAKEENVGVLKELFF